MAIDMFMKVEGADGEAKDAKHKGWTHIESYSWGMNQVGSMAHGGGGGSGKVSINDVHVVAKIDKSTTPIMKHCANGKHLSKVEIEVCKAGGEQVVYNKITMTDVMVTSVQPGGSAHGEDVMIQYSFQGAKVKMQYWEQTDKGGRGGEQSVEYDLKSNETK